jgi:hypothetical protein
MITPKSMLLLATGVVMGIAGQARAQDGDLDQPAEIYSAGYEVAADPNAPPEPYGPPPIPPDVEAQAVAGPGNAFCYSGPHPVDTRVASGPAWDETQGPHTHFYAPFDLRLFRLDGSCYSFIGDPQDFGYQGQVYSYYGAHPIHGDYGGGWCFMVGGHHHWWHPWSTSFVIVNSWYYWNGPYDRVFWNYWPYYSYYYQSYYPHYYGGGRFTRRRDFHVAPRINHIPDHYARGWRSQPGGTGVPAGRGGGQWRGGPPAAPAPVQRHGSPAAGNWAASSGGWRGSAPAPSAPAPSSNGGWRGQTPAASAPAPSSGGWGTRGHSPAAAAASSGGWARGAASRAASPPPAPSPAPARMPSAPVPSSSGGWKGGGGSSNHTGSARGGWRH